MENKSFEILRYITLNMESNSELLEMMPAMTEEDAMDIYRVLKQKERRHLQEVTEITSPCAGISFS